MGYLRQDDPLSDILDPSYVTSDAVINAPWLYQDAEPAPAPSEGIDWTLINCCGTSEIVFICLIAGYMVIIYFLWNTMIMKPMKLIAVFIHGKFESVFV